MCEDLGDHLKHQQSKTNMTTLQLLNGFSFCKCWWLINWGGNKLGGGGGVCCNGIAITKWSWEKLAATSKRTESRSKKAVKGHVTLQNIQGVTESLACTLCVADIIVHMHHNKNICDILVAPEDPAQKMYLSGVNYAVKCGSCDSILICWWDWSFSQKRGWVSTTGNSQWYHIMPKTLDI